MKAARLGILSLLALVAARSQFAPLKTKLKPETAAAFVQYSRRVETELDQRWSGKRAFLKTDEDTAARTSVMNGEVWVAPAADPNPLPIQDGLIHDWFGAVYMPHATLERVLAVLQDFDNHAKIYPPITQSRLVRRSGDDITGFWRLEQKGQILPAVFDVTQTVHYKKAGTGKWTVRSHADDIRAIENGGASKERVLPPGEGIGLIWKLYSYWTLQQLDGGVVAECRTLSLSRGIPSGVAWMFRPFLNTVPRESMDSTLRNTRKAVAE